MQASDSCKFAGWALIDLDDPALNRTCKIGRQLECCIDDFIEQAMEEKLARVDAQGGSRALGLELREVKPLRKPCGLEA